MKSLAEARTPFFLTASELDPVFHWKLGGQFGRVRQLLQRNSDAEYRAVTAAAFAVTRPEITEEASRRLRILTCLEGVGVPIASAILALVDPGRYCVIDFRAWIALYCVAERSFTIGHYQKYLMDVTMFSIELGWLVQETDLALWAFYEHVTRAR